MITFHRSAVAAILVAVLTIDSIGGVPLAARNVRGKVKRQLDGNVVLPDLTVAPPAVELPGLTIVPPSIELPGLNIGSQGESGASSPPSEVPEGASPPSEVPEGASPPSEVPAGSAAPPEVASPPSEVPEVTAAPEVSSPPPEVPSEVPEVSSPPPEVLETAAPPTEGPPAPEESSSIPSEITESSPAATEPSTPGEPATEASTPGSVAAETTTAAIVSESTLPTISEVVTAITPVRDMDASPPPPRPNELPESSSRLPTFIETIGRGQVSRQVFDCTGKPPGVYGNPKVACDTKFYICVDPTVLAYEQSCAARLYFDDEIKVCEAWIHVPACSGKPRPSPAPTQPPRNESLPTTAPAIDCVKKADGNYPDPKGTISPGCSNIFYVCNGGRTLEARCPVNLVYDHDTNQCDFQDHVFACTGKRWNETVTTTKPAPTLPPVDFNCAGKPNGYYVTKCSATFYSCVGGQARALECPSGLVYDPDLKACEVPSNVALCAGSGKPRPPTKAPTTTRAPVKISTTPSPLDCMLKPDGLYRDPLEKCSRGFYYCAHNESFHMDCPANLFYDAENKRCDIWLNVFDCSGQRPTSPPKTPSTPVPTFPPVSFDCTKLEDGNYPNPDNKCSKFYYTCGSMDAFKQDCPADLYYDPDRNLCDSWIRVFACSGRTIPPNPTTTTLNVTVRPTKPPVIDCPKKGDGIYADPSKACSGIFYECSGGYEYQMECQKGLFFNVQNNQCDHFDNVFACSGKTLAPVTVGPSTTKFVPVPMPVDCTFLADGDYEDPKQKCSNTYYSCSGGYAFKRNCPDQTFFDSERDQCDRFVNVFSCTGKRPPTTTSGPSTTRTPRPKYPFDCTKQFDGNYPDGDCSQKYWSCVGGLTFPQECPNGLIYDAERNECGLSSMLPKCGGQRITPGPKPIPTSRKPVVFDCTFLEDGNYPDPTAKDNCSRLFYSCSSGIGSVRNCPSDLYFDMIGNTCDHRERVVACGGRTDATSPAESSTLPGENGSPLETASVSLVPFQVTKTVKTVRPQAFDITVLPEVPASESPAPESTAPASESPAPAPESPAPASESPAPESPAPASESPAPESPAPASESPAPESPAPASESPAPEEPGSPPPSPIP